MSSEVEAAGAAITAGLASAVIDKGGAYDGDAHGPCTNCGAEMTGNYCAACGQPTHIHRKLGHMVEEFVHGILHFDARAWRTLPLVLFRPGTLTRNYVLGKRARYISPLALFLFAMFTMFFVFSLTDGARVGVSDTTNVKTPVAAKEIASEIAEQYAGGGGPAPIAGDHEGQSMLEQISSAAADGDLNINTGSKKLDEKIRHKLENPELALYKLQNTAYKLAFLLVPISLPFVWLLFAWKRGVTLFDHTVFILYSLSFVSLVFIAMSLASMVPPALEYVGGWLTVALPIHMFFHLKGAYALGWFSAVWRTAVLTVFAGISLLIFLLAIIGLGFVG